MKHMKLLSIAAGAAAAVVVPLTALTTSDTLSFSINPTTHGQNSTVTSVLTTNPPNSNSILTSSTTTLPSGESICNWGATCSPASGTNIGTASVKAQFVCGFTSTQNYNIEWLQPDGGFTPPTGETVVSEVRVLVPFNNTDAYITVDSSSIYRIHVPSYPNIVCAGTSSTITNTLGTFNGTNYNLNLNPSTVGTFTVTNSDSYSSGGPNSASATYSTT